MFGLSQKYIHVIHSKKKLATPIRNCRRDKKALQKLRHNKKGCKSAVMIKI